jgi:hypothetical protein
MQEGPLQRMPTNPQPDHNPIVGFCCKRLNGSPSPAFVLVHRFLNGKDDCHRFDNNWGASMSRKRILSLRERLLGARAFCRKARSFVARSLSDF